MFDRQEKKVLLTCLINAIHNSNAPGAVAFLGRNDEILFFDAVGKSSVIPLEEEMGKDTIFDLASLTKVIATTTAILILYQKGKLNLDDSVYRYINVPIFKKITLKHLLTHSSGLIGYEEWYKEIFSLEDILIKLSKTKLLFEPGTRHLYSDFGFMLLAHIVELISGERFDQFCQKNIFSKLNMNTTFFNVPEEYKNKCAPTEKCEWRKRIIRGEVHDEHAYAIGGIAGHAGLFSTAEDLSRFFRGMLRAYILEKNVIEEMATCKTIPDYPWQVLGWKTDPFWESIEGQLPFRSALGHTGFTGTCLWWDRVSGYYAILLSNSCHPSRKTRDNRKLRMTFYNSVSILISPEKINVHYGLDVLIKNDFKPIKKASIALFTNSSARNITGKTALDIISSTENIKLKYIFSAEHGLQLSEEAGKSDKQKNWNNIQILNIYDREATIDWQRVLEQVDWVVVDIQDIGSRYYTYIYSLFQLMKICTQYNRKVMILDRPNPLGGDIVEGILPDEGFIREVCWGYVPIRHGLTIGESALYLKNTSSELKSLELSIIKMDGWFYDLQFPKLDLQWFPPSPNIPTFDSAFCYVGTCLFEGTNMSEGRGTPHPFQTIGAPWCNPELIVSNLPLDLLEGFEIKPCEFMPVPIEGRATIPKYMNELCKGFQITVKNYYTAKPFKLTLELLRLMKMYHSEYFAFNNHFDRLAGTTTLRKMIEKKDSDDIKNMESEVQKYLMARPYLYPKFKEERRKMFESV